MWPRPKAQVSPPATKRESSIVEVGSEVDDVGSERGRFDGITPDEKIPARVRVWSILQDRPKIPTKELMRILKIDSRTLIQKYRKEYTGRIKVKFKN